MRCERPIDSGGRSVITGHGCTALSAYVDFTGFKVAYMPAWSAVLLGRVDGLPFHRFFCGYN